MGFSSSLAVTAALAASALASAFVTPRESLNDESFRLQTNTSNGGSYNGLYVYAYHTGAGLNDAMLDANQTVGNLGIAFTGGVTGKSPYFAVQFDLGGYPYELIPSNGTTPYPDLSPVRINVNGDPPSTSNAFYFEADTLKWTSDVNTQGGFAGWLACKSEHGSLENPSVPGVQLFYRTTPGPAPEGCNDIDLVPIY